MLGRVAAGFATVFVTVVAMSGSALAQSPPAAPNTIAVGDWQLVPSFESRMRGEYRRDAPDLGGFDFYGRLGPRVPDAWAASERTRVGIGVERGNVRGQLTLQDARALGTPAPTGTLGAARGTSLFGPYEAYVEMRTSSARPSSIRIGRQAVVWGEGRLIGSADFSPTGRSLDAARAHLAAGKFDFEALAVVLEAPGPLGSAFGDRAGPAQSGEQLYGLSARFTLDPLLAIEAFGIARVARTSNEVLDGSRFANQASSGERYTGALRVSGEGKGWAYGAEGAYQLGTAATLSVGGTDIAAYAGAAHVAKTFPELTLTPTFRVGGSYASGDNGSGTYHQFDPLLADPQRFHGQMDLFAWSNIIDVSARAQIVPMTDTTFAVEYRYARMANTAGEWIGSYLTAVGGTAPVPGRAAAGYAPITQTPDAELGHELDVTLAWRPWLPLELRAGWSGLLRGNAARNIMANYARGAVDNVGVLSPARVAQYAFGQVTLSMP